MKQAPSKLLVSFLIVHSCNLTCAEQVWGRQGYKAKEINDKVQNKGSVQTQ